MNDWKAQLLNTKNLATNTDKHLKFIDTHAHYYHSKFNKNVHQLLTEILPKDLSHIINLGTDVKSNQQTIELIEKYEILYGMVGFFPTSTYLIDDTLCNDAKLNRENFEKQLTLNKIVGIGEIGLDYHWDVVGERGYEIHGIKAREIQKKWFMYQLDLAKMKNLPVSMHSRDAERDTLEIFNEYEYIKGVMHCYSYGLDSAKKYLNKGIYLGIGGTSTYKSNAELIDVIKYAPLDRILLETDAPYLSPQQVRKNTNISSYISYVISHISQIKKVSEDKIIEQTNKNAFELFELSI